MGAVDPVAAADALIGAVVYQLEQAGVDVPARRGKVPGDAIAWDSEQLTLNLRSISRGQPQAPMSPQTGFTLPTETIFFYEFQVVLLRSVSHLTGVGRDGIPTMTKLEADFVVTAADSVALAEALRTIHAGYLLVPVGIPFAYGPVVPVGPDGALSGSVCPVSFQAGMTDDY